MVKWDLSSSLHLSCYIQLRILCNVYSEPDIVCTGLVTNPTLALGFEMLILRTKLVSRVEYIVEQTNQV